MGKIVAYLLAGIGVGVGFAYWQGIGRPLVGIGSGTAADGNGSIASRLSELETELALERFERQVLADELAELREALAGLPAGEVAFDAEDLRRQPSGTSGRNEGGRSAEERMRERFPNGVPQTPEEIAAYRRQQQIDAYVAAGLTLDRAQWILQREDELAMEVLQARYEATQGGATEQEVASISASQLLRKELGDADYEKYLEGQGRPTSIGVRDVLTNSPAQIAGLQPGDEIVAYNGQRVFDINELNALTYQARPGSTVAIEVLRDGQTLQVYVEGGPIGISGGGRSTRDVGGPGSARGGLAGAR